MLHLNPCKTSIMKKIFLFLFTATAILLSGCFETTEEITLNADGSGTFSNTNDMSAMIPLIKQMGGKEVENMGDEAIDSTIALSSKLDSIENLSADEKELLKKGT